jgi:hypothetical protein
VSADADLDLALERVIDAARGHLRAVKAAGGAVDDDAVWAAYVELNNSSLAYDELLEDSYGEVTPWDVADELTVDVTADLAADTGGDAELAGEGEPVELRISVRQRRDYLVPRLGALLRAGAQARANTWQGVNDKRAEEPVQSIGEAVSELLHAGGGSMAGLDVPELLPQSGVVLVNVVEETLGPDDLAAPPHQADQLFELADSPLIVSLYEPGHTSLEEGEPATERDRSGPATSDDE